MNTDQLQRLATMRTQWMLWSAVQNTSSWESTFFFELLDEKDREIARLRQSIEENRNGK